MCSTRRTAAGNYNRVCAHKHHDTTTTQHISNASATHQQQQHISKTSATATHKQHISNSNTSTAARHQQHISSMSTAAHQQQHVISNTSATHQQQHVISNTSTAARHQQHISSCQQQHINNTSAAQPTSLFRGIALVVQSDVVLACLAATQRIHQRMNGHQHLSLKQKPSQLVSQAFHYQLCKYSCASANKLCMLC
jgi:hypothetical protein